MTTALWQGRVVLRDGFSLSSFWPDMNQYGCTRVPMFGATAYFLLSQEPRP